MQQKRTGCLKHFVRRTMPTASSSQPAREFAEKREREKKKFIDHKQQANKRCDNQNNKLMWQAASEEIPI